MKKLFAAIAAAALLVSAAVLPVSASEGTASSDEPTSVLIYEETFDRADESDHAATLAALGWVEQNKSMGAYTDPSAKLKLVDGRLEVAGASDTYFLMLDEETMAPYDGETITIQYDVEYTTASDTSRYICVLGNYAGKKYNSFHFRNRGTGNNQTHYDGGWPTYDSYRAEYDAYAIAEDKDNGTSIAMKLLGVKYDGSSLFSAVPVTIRYVLDVDEGTNVYMKLAEQPEEDFVLVSKYDGSSEGATKYRTWNANAVCLKIGGTQNGYVDHIAVWTGNGDYPKPEPEVVETEPPVSETIEPTETPEEPEGGESESEESEVPTEPETVREPHTIVNKLAIWAVAIFGGWIVLKKSKETSEA